MQRRRLLLAICAVVAESGLEAASVARVCQRAGVSRRTFYEAFDDREQCFLAAFDEVVECVACEVVPVYRREERWSVRVRAGLTVLLEYLDAHPEAARVCVVEALRGGPAVLERRRGVIAVLVAAVDEGRAEAKHGSGPLPLSAEGVVGGALAVVHALLLDPERPRLVRLANALTAMIVHPYLGAAAARRELDRPAPKASAATIDGAPDPFQGLAIRFTYRTARVLATIAEDPGANNRMIADSSGIGDEGQMSRLLRRLERAGLIENKGGGHPHGEPNAWWLTERGEAIHHTLAGATRTNDESK
jgi:AcrR family transcriptional regulator